MNVRFKNANGTPYTNGRYWSPIDPMSGEPMYRSYQEHFEKLVMMYYHLWSHRTHVTIMVLKDKLGIPVESGLMTSHSSKVSIYDIDWEAIMSALRMHGIDVEYGENKCVQLLKDVIE